MTEDRIIIADGKYEIVLRADAPSEVIRHGERRTSLPSNLEYALACEVRDLRAIIQTITYKSSDGGVYSSYVEDAELEKVAPGIRAVHGA